MTKIVAKLSELPNSPAVYAMYAGNAGKGYVAYVGLADKLKQRVSQHLIRRDSSVVTGVAAVSLNPSLITEVRWFEHPGFTDRTIIEAAEIVAFDVLEPVLRSRGALTERAKGQAKERTFRAEFERIFSSEPTGILV